jgi:hypothetical protein
MNDIPIPLPARAYPSGTGHAAGSDTSAAREAEQDDDGTSSATQSAVLDVLLRHPKGLTWKECDDLAKIGHHGKTSGALTNLRQAGEVFWLHATREGCHVFVHKAWRERFHAEQVKNDTPKPTRERAEAAEEVARGVDAYMADPTIERWDFIREAHTQWVALR